MNGFVPVEVTQLEELSPISFDSRLEHLALIETVRDPAIHKQVSRRSRVQGRQTSLAEKRAYEEKQGFYGQ